MMLYREMDFKEASMGPIPREWEVVNLGNQKYFDILPSGIEEFDGKKSYLSTKSIQGSTVTDIESEIIFSKRPSRANMQPVLNSVWFAKMKNTVKVYSFTQENSEEANKYILSTGFCGIRCKEKAHPHYLRQIFLWRSFNKLKDSLVTGSTQQDIKQHSIAKIEIPFPNRAEQEEIAKMLTTVDETIQKVEQIIAKSETLKKGLMQELLAKGIGDKEFKQTLIGKIPKEWGVYPCSDLCKEITVGIVVTPAKYYTASGVPCLRSFNIQENEIIPKDLVYISPEANELHKKSIIHTGDVVAVRTGQPGTSSAVPPAFDGANCIDLIIFRPNDKIRPDFLSCFLNSPVAKRQVIAGQTGSVQQHFNIGMAKKLKVVLPSLHEQEKIASILYLIHGKRKFEIEEKAKLECIKRGLMDLLLTGKVRVKVA